MAFAIGMTGAYAQKTVKVEKTGNDTEETTDSGETETMPLPDKEDARRSPSTGDLFDGLTRPVALDVYKRQVQVLTHADPGYHVRRVFGKVRQSGGSAPRVQG